MSKNGNVEQCFWMLQSNSGAYGGPETGYFVQVQGMNKAMLLVKALDG